MLKKLKTHLIFLKKFIIQKNYIYTSFFVFFFYYFYELTNIKRYTLISNLVKLSHHVDIVTMFLIKLCNAKQSNPIIGLCKAKLYCNIFKAQIIMNTNLIIYKSVTPRAVQK